MDFADCPCSGKTLARLLNPAILLCLARQPAHGYLLLQQLAELKMFADGEPDDAGLNRTLKQMESQGIVCGVDHSVVQARRVFADRDRRSCLDRWVRTLERYRDAIDELLDQMPTCRQEN